MILAPVTTKEDRLMNKHDENGNVILDESGNPVQEMRAINLTHFKTTTVFDISQTSGDPLPSLVHDLTGSSNEVKAIIQTIQSVCTIPIEFKTETENFSFMTGAKGYYSPRKDKIVYTFGFSQLSTKYETTFSFMTGAKGYYSPRKDKIVYTFGFSQLSTKYETTKPPAMRVVSKKCYTK